jgi:hypothetical protein
MRSLATALACLVGLACLASPASADIRPDPDWPARRPPAPSPRPATPPTTEAPSPAKPELPRPVVPPAPEPKKREGAGYPMGPEWLFGLGVLALGLGGLYRHRPRRAAAA